MLASVLTTNLAILVLAGFVGFIVISKIPNTLHTPLMSGTNAIHGVVLLGALLLLGLPEVGVVKLDAFSEVLLVIAVAFGTINIVGGFLVTDRMLDMFKSRPKPTPGVTEPPKTAPIAGGAPSTDAAAAKADTAAGADADANSAEQEGNS